MSVSEQQARHLTILVAIGAVTSNPLRTLTRLDRKAHVYNEQWCNGDITEEIYEDAITIITTGVERVFGGKLPDGFVLNRDPRGYALKLDDTYIRNAEGPVKDIFRDFGGYGILAPEFRN